MYKHFPPTLPLVLRQDVDVQMRRILLQHLRPRLQHTAVRLIHGLSEVLDIRSFHLWIPGLDVRMWYKLCIYGRSEHVAPALRERRCIRRANAVTHHAPVAII
jgi:hypothetical protein